MTNLQQNELDKIEKHILISLFGKESIPEPTAITFKLMNINPNKYIQKFENFMQPLMKENGQIDGKILKKIIQFSKYKNIFESFSIPDTDFYLSDMCITILQKIIPGVIL